MRDRQLVGYPARFDLSHRYLKRRGGYGRTTNEQKHKKRHMRTVREKKLGKKKAGKNRTPEGEGRKWKHGWRIVV